MLYCVKILVHMLTIFNFLWSIEANYKHISDVMSVVSCHRTPQSIYECYIEYLRPQNGEGTLHTCMDNWT